MAATQKNTHEIEKAKALNHVPWCEEYEKMISGMLYMSPSHLLYEKHTLTLPAMHPSVPNSTVPGTARALLRTHSTLGFPTPPPIPTKASTCWPVSALSCCRESSAT